MDLRAERAAISKLSISSSGGSLGSEAMACGVVDVGIKRRCVIDAGSQAHDR